MHPSFPHPLVPHLINLHNLSRISSGFPLKLALILFDLTYWYGNEILRLNMIRNPIIKIYVPATFLYHIRFVDFIDNYSIRSYFHSSSNGRIGIRISYLNGVAWYKICNLLMVAYNYRWDLRDHGQKLHSTATNRIYM